MHRAEAGSKVAVLGASPKEDRYSFMAVQMLGEHGHHAIPVHPAGHTVNGIPGVTSLGKIDGGVDTLTMYVNAKISDNVYDKIIKLGPRRVIFNPGAENPNLAEKLRNTGIEVVEACTLVMLRTEQF